MRIIRNSAYCFLCDQEIVSTHVHHMASCDCGNIMVDGGNEYLKRAGDIDWENSVDTSIIDHRNP